MLVIPWKTIELEMQARHLDFDKTAKALNLSPRWLHELIKGEKQITPLLAQYLETVFWISAWSWMNLEKFYQTQKEETLVTL